MAQDFASLGIAAVIFNFRGCGDSDGNFDMMGWTRDLDAVLDKVLNTSFIDPTRVMMLGFSGGGAAAVHTASDNKRIFALATVAAPAHFGMFESTPEAVLKDFRHRGIIRDDDFPPDLQKWWSEFGEIEPRHWIAYFEGKHLLIVHGDADELIPVEHAKEIYEKAPGGIAKLEIIHGGAHKLRTNEQCMTVLKTWFTDILGWKSPS
jgi:pimeloyl-ACP methyl ester carboxylesterase